MRFGRSSSGAEGRRGPGGELRNGLLLGIGNGKHQRRGSVQQSSRRNEAAFLLRLHSQVQADADLPASSDWSCQDQEQLFLMVRVFVMVWVFLVI